MILKSTENLFGFVKILIDSDNLDNLDKLGRLVDVAVGSGGHLFGALRHDDGAATDRVGHPVVVEVGFQGALGSGGGGGGVYC